MSKNKTKLITGAVIIAIVVIGAILVFTPREEEDSIKVGAMLILSGEGGAWGQASQRAIELAVKEVNEEGGINGTKIEVIYEDTQGSTSKAVLIYEKLVNIDNVAVIIGPNFQTEMSAIAPKVNEDKFPIIAPSYAPLSDRPNPKNPLLIWLDPTTEAEQMAEYVYNKGVETISVLGTQDSWEKEVSTAFANKFELLGGEVEVLELLQHDKTNVRTSVFKAIQNNPDALYLGTYYQFLNIAKVTKELDFKGELYSIEVDEYLAYESRESTSGMEFISSDTYKEEFRTKYEETYGEKSNIPAGQSYDAMNIIIDFLKENSSREGILKQMEEFTSYEGVSGTITITEDKKTIIPTAIYKLQEGEIVKI